MRKKGNNPEPTSNQQEPTNQDLFLETNQESSRKPTGDRPTRIRPGTYQEPTKPTNQDFWETKRETNQEPTSQKPMPGIRRATYHQTGQEPSRKPAKQGSGRRKEKGTDQ